MAFKSGGYKHLAIGDPAAHFKTLTKRQFPDVMPHQKEMLEQYAANFEGVGDIALQLPTGSGKTLVGLLIADWRRIKNKERVVYLCPTKQLVQQTVQQATEKYGIDVVDLSGKKDSFPVADRTAYVTGQKIAISTYSGLFNSNTFFADPDVIIIDDAHAAENYIAKMWSVEIETQTNLHTALSEFLKQHIGHQSYARLTGNWVGPADAYWVEKLPSPLVSQLKQSLIEIIDAHSNFNVPSIYFPWSLVRDHVDACQIYLASREILIRPLIPPTFSHHSFTSATQRIFMSATLGAGGDLERITGRKKIERLPAPLGFQSAGVGRRFFVLPSLSLDGQETERLRVALQRRSGRSVVLTPSTTQAATHMAQVAAELPGFEVFGIDSIEADKSPFVNAPHAVAVLANRYDGIDFPGDECRLLCVDGLPRAMNAQERFLMSKFGASALYNERIQTRVLQATGRCTRALQDRSAVIVTGTELVDFLADDRNWRHFHPEMQAELSFGVDQSLDVSADQILENFDMFMNNNVEWASADATIRSQIVNFQQTPFPGMDDLEKAVSFEIDFQVSLWNQDLLGALASARSVLGTIQHPDLRGYRALWHYLAGCVCRKLSVSGSDGQDLAAAEQFDAAKKAAPSISWLNTLASAIGETAPSTLEAQSIEVMKQVEAIEQQFLQMGTATNVKFEQKVTRISNFLSDGATFESGQTELGNLLGFSSGNDETDAAPDPWWIGYRIGLVFEDHVDANEATIFGAVKARQASGHPNWIKMNVPGTKDLEITPVLVTPCRSAQSGAEPQLQTVRFWALSDFRHWASNAIAVLRELKGTFPAEGDLAWRATAYQRLVAEVMTLPTIISSRPFANQAFTII
jgi:Type III restriction enzyme, res subunit/Helicase C-terminal domain